jgi:hypothetical protein
MDPQQVVLNGHQSPQQESPQPSPQFAIQALQAEVHRLRQDIMRADDSRVYLQAMLAQLQVETQTEIARLTEELNSQESAGESAG